MKKIWNKIKDIFSTFSLTVLFTLNLFLIVFVFLLVVTVLVYFGIDSGFLVEEGRITLGGALVMIYSVCILIAVSIVFMIRKVFIEPIRQIMNAMEELAHGNFDVRIDLSKDKYRPREIKEFAQSFNKTAAELQGTEILRKDFINNFSHEFKTPIVSINGFAELLIEEDLPLEDQKEYLGIIRDESRRLAELSATILTLSRVESQTILRDRETFRLDEQIRQSVMVTEQKWKDKSIDFQVTLEKVQYSGNPALLKEVWLNLLDNAVKFSPDGEVVGMTLHQKKDRIVAAITDHGPGMDEMTVSHIFEQFYQGDTSHKTQGNGLGLAMAQKIVQLHGGEITVDTAPGRGSCFTVTLFQASV